MKKIYTVRDARQQQAHLWNETDVAHEIAACDRRQIMRFMLEHLPRDEKILEAGCGLGAWVAALSARGYDIEGIDHDAAALERVRRARPGLRVSAGDICRLPHADGSLGAYVSLGVMEHFEEGWERPMAEARRVLRPGGLLLFAVPVENLFRRVVAHPLRGAYLAWRRRRGDAIHFAEYRYRPAEVARRLASDGFTLVASTWDDFVPRTMSLGLWADFPQLHGPPPYRLRPLGALAAAALNGVSRRLAPAGVFFVARKRS